MLLTCSATKVAARRHRRMNAPDIAHSKNRCPTYRLACFCWVSTSEARCAANRSLAMVHGDSRLVDSRRSTKACKRHGDTHELERLDRFVAEIGAIHFDAGTTGP